MARTGRPPKPLEEKRRTGNPGKRKLPPTEATVTLLPATGPVEPPTTLQEVGRELWDRIWSGPARRWLSPEIDGLRVLTVCHLHDEAERYRNMIRQMGPVILETVTTSSGQQLAEKRVVKNPIVAMLRDVEKNLDRELSQLGFDPVARARLGLAEIKAASKLEELAAKRAARGTRS